MLQRQRLSKRSYRIEEKMKLLLAVTWSSHLPLHMFILRILLFLCISIQTCQSQLFCKYNPCAVLNKCSDLRTTTSPYGAPYTCECPDVVGTGNNTTVSMANGQNCLFFEYPRRCNANPCKNNGLCFERQPNFSYFCYCQHPWTGRLCDILIERCDGIVCKNNGTCVNTFDGFVCNCLPGWKGKLCDRYTDNCESLPCLYEGNCTNLPNGYLCTCLDGYLGTQCEQETNECESLPCANGGTCLDDVGGYWCQCSGASGDNCETYLDECASDPCVNGGTCNDHVNGFTCLCGAGFIGLLCEGSNQCETLLHCANGGSCLYVDVNGVIHLCLCPTGFRGSHCEIADHCKILLPCLNGGTCVLARSGTTPMYTCTCPDGFSGDTCQTASQCRSDPCLNSGECVQGLVDYTCTCPPNFTSANCEVPTQCIDLARCSSNQTCVQLASTYACKDNAKIIALVSAYQMSMPIASSQTGNGLVAFALLALCSGVISGVLVVSISKLILRKQNASLDDAQDK